MMMGTRSTMVFCSIMMYTQTIQSKNITSIIAVS